eukprot:1287204-Prymnesium_polylepis.1
MPAQPVRRPGLSTAWRFARKRGRRAMPTRPQAGDVSPLPTRARRVRPAHLVDAALAVSKLKVDFRTSPLIKMDFKGRFEEISASPSCWCA